MRYDNFVIKPLNTGGLTSVSGALITVCTSAGTGTPCTPKVANIYSDEALTTPITGTGGAGTMNSDSGGNFGFYLSPGSYIVTVTGAGITSYTIKLVLPTGLSTTNSFTNLDSILYVDGLKYATIDAAIAAVPSFSIVAATGCIETGNSATCTTTAPHGFAANQTIFVLNVTNNGFNGEFPLVSVTPTTFTYLVCAVSRGGGSQCTTGLGTSGGGTVAPAAHIIVPPNYYGAEVSTCSNLDNAGNNIGYWFSNTPSNIHIEDRRGTSNCAYNIGLNSNQLQSSPNNLSIWRRDTSPNITSSNLVTDMQVTGTIPGGQSLAGGTFEVDTVGNTTTPSGLPFIQATNSQWAVRSLGGTLTQVMGASGGGGIDRSYVTTNITQASGVYCFDPKNTSSSGATILEAYGCIGAAPTTGTRNNYSFFSQGNSVWGDNFGIDVMNASYALPAGATGQKLLRFGGDNSQATGGVTQWSTAFAGIPYHFLSVAGTQSNFMICSLCNAANSFEITPSTAAGGTTFSTPGLRVFNNGAGGASTVAIDSGGLQPRVAGAGALGTNALPFANMCLGTAATNNICTSVSAMAAARTLTVPDPLGNVTMPYTIASGTSTLTVNAALAAVTSQAAITTAGTGILTTDAIEWAYASAPTAGDSLCHVSAYVTAGNVNFVRTNPTAAAQSVSAIVLNWRVIR